MSLSTRGRARHALSVWTRRLLVIGGAALISAAMPTKTLQADLAEILPEKTPAAGTPASRSQLSKEKSLADGRSRRRLVTLRGEIVDYYCYIEKGARGPGHRDCGVKCVAGDVCMGLLTTDDQLMMISVNHMRAMEPLTWRDTPDPFTACRTLIAEQVELTGYLMERKGQRIIEVMGVKPVPAKP